MRQKFVARAARSRKAVAAALLITTPFAVAAPLAANVARAQNAPPAITVTDATLYYGQATTVRGQSSTGDAGRTATLQFGSDAQGYRALASTRVGTDGRYQFTTRLTRSGSVRVAVGDGATGTTASASSSNVALSAPTPVAVSAQLLATVRRLNVLAGRWASVSGHLRPARAGRWVTLQRLYGRSWRTIARARTSRTGYYRLVYRAARRGSAYVRVQFGGDASNVWTYRRIGVLRAYRTSFASTYTAAGGALGCGGSASSASLIVAHKSLPCGSHVAIHYRGRTVVAVVRDRGPYVGGREFDLSSPVAARLGFNGIGTIWVTS